MCQHTQDDEFVVPDVPEDYHSEANQKARFIQHVTKIGDIVKDDSGYYIYWPQQPGGFLDSFHLHWLAEHLDEINKEWDEQIAKDLG
jgi:hypothetical protein